MAEEALVHVVRITEVAQHCVPESESIVHAHGLASVGKGQKLILDEVHRGQGKAAVVERLEECERV